eukprot:gb/GFBE01053854.1/.p1 GENE.gb/GFBE01053854.1/~~gb/GFBE01053854.1/.p1  ORF type:complete len:501 (+),score=99.04 gb/GFBE01053854.1/:1-1503(+)
MVCISVRRIVAAAFVLGILLLTAETLFETNLLSQAELLSASLSDDGSEQNSATTTGISTSAAATAPASTSLPAPMQTTTIQVEETLGRDGWAKLKRAAEAKSYLGVSSTLCNLSRSMPPPKAKDVRQWPQEVRDMLVQETQRAAESSYHALAEHAPAPHALPKAEASAKLCSDKRWNGVFSGALRGEPAVVVDILSGMQGGGEIPLLEIRLYEFADLVTLTVVGEGRHNHRGDVKHLSYPAFRDTLFEPFKASIQHIIMEDAKSPSCKRYQQRLQELRAHTGLREQNEWTLQNSQRQCIWEEFLKHHPEIPDDALVLFSDLDEFPSRDLVTALKFCELKQEKQWKPLGLKHRFLNYNLRSTIGGKCEKPHKQGSVNLKGQMDGVRLGYKNSREVPGGAHLSYYGSMPQIVYKGVNHAEGGGSISTVTQSDKVINPCQVTEANAVEMATLLRDDPRFVVRHWEHHHELMPKGTPSPQELGLCGVPKFLRANAWRYPDFFGV